MMEEARGPGEAGGRKEYLMGTTRPVMMEDDTNTLTGIWENRDTHEWWWRGDSND